MVSVRCNNGHWYLQIMQPEKWAFHDPQPHYFYIFSSKSLHISNENHSQLYTRIVNQGYLHLHTVEQLTFGIFQNITVFV